MTEPHETPPHMVRSSDHRGPIYCPYEPHAGSLGGDYYRDVDELLRACAAAGLTNVPSFYRVLRSPLRAPDVSGFVDAILDDGAVEPGSMLDAPRILSLQGFVDQWCADSGAQRLHPSAVQIELSEAHVDRFNGLRFEAWSARAVARGCLDLPPLLRLAFRPNDPMPREMTDTVPALRELADAVLWRRAGNGRPCVVVLCGGPDVPRTTALITLVAAPEHEAKYLLTDHLLADTEAPDWSERSHARAPEFVAIDDPNETAAPFSAPLLALLAERYDRGLFTAVATPLSPEQFRARHLVGDAGARLASRLDEQRDHGLSPLRDLARPAAAAEAP